MSDPTKVDITDWFAVVAAGLMAGVLAGMSAAFLWFRRSKERLYAEIIETKQEFIHHHETLQKDWDRRHDKVERSIVDMGHLMNTHAVQLEKLTTIKDYLTSSLEELKKEGRDQNRKLSRLLERNNGYEEE